MPEPRLKTLERLEKIGDQTNCFWALALRDVGGPLRRSRWPWQDGPRGGSEARPRVATRPGQVGTADRGIVPEGVKTAGGD